MKKFFLLIIAGLLCSSVLAQDTTVYRFTLEECLEYAFRYSYNRQAMILSEQANEEIYRYSKQQRLPNLNLSLSEGYSNSKTNSSNWNGDYGLNTNIIISQGGNLNQTIRQNKLISEQSEYNTKQYENQLTIQILQAFLNVLGAEELLRFQEAVVIATEEQLKQGREQLRLGQILESDYLLLEAQYASDQDNIIDTRISIENNLLSLKSLLSMDPAAKLRIVYPDTSAINNMMSIPSRQEVLERAVSTLPDLVISDYNIDIARLNVDLAKSAYYPTISLGAGIGSGHLYNFNGFGKQLEDRFSQQVNISLSLPIYNRGQTKSRVVQSQIAVQQAELDKMNTNLTVRQTVIQEYQNVIGSRSKYQAADVKQNAYLKTFEAYSARFTFGDITPVDLLQQQNNYINALYEYIQAKYGFMLRRKILDVYMGLEVKI